MATKKHKKCNGKKSRKSSKNSKNKMRGGSHRSKSNMYGIVSVPGPVEDQFNAAAASHKTRSSSKNKQDGVFFKKKEKLIKRIIDYKSEDKTVYKVDGADFSLENIKLDTIELINSASTLLELESARNQFESIINYPEGKPHSSGKKSKNLAIRPNKLSKAIVNNSL